MPPENILPNVLVCKGLLVVPNDDVGVVVCCFKIDSHNQVRGHRTGSSHSRAEEYPTENTHTQPKVTRGDAFQEIRPGARAKTGFSVEEMLGGLPLLCGKTLRIMQISPSS